MRIVIAATVAAPFFANAWGLGDALNKVNDATRKVQAVTQGVWSPLVDAEGPLALAGGDRLAGSGGLRHLVAGRSEALN